MDNTKVTCCFCDAVIDTATWEGDLWVAEYTDKRSKRHPDKDLYYCGACYNAKFRAALTVNLGVSFNLRGREKVLYDCALACRKPDPDELADADKLVLSREMEEYLDLWEQAFRSGRTNTRSTEVGR